MASTILRAAGVGDGAAFTSGDDGNLKLQTGPNGAKVDALSFAADGTPTLLKGPTIGTAPTPVPAGSAPIYGARAWCLFDGSLAGTNAPTAGGNVTSVTKNSAGDYTVNFTVAMPNTNYVLVGSVASNTSSSSVITIIKAVSQLGAPANKTTTACQIITNNYSGSNTDNVTNIQLVFFG